MRRWRWWQGRLHRHHPPTTTEPPAPPPPAPAQATTQQLVQQYYDTAQKVTASGLPAKGEDRYSFFDACALNNGRTKSSYISSWDATASGNAYTAGRTFSNIQIVAERKTTNADGSARHEVDVTVDTKYTDGTSVIGGSETLIAELRRQIADAGPDGMRLAKVNPAMRGLGVCISKHPEGTWRKWFAAHNAVFDLDARGPDAAVRLR